MGVTPAARLPSKVTRMRLGLALDQRLRGQHMDHLGGADAEGDGAHAAVGAGVAVAAHQQGARQGNALLRSHDMDDALAGLAEIEQLYAPALGLVAHVIEPLRVGLQRFVGASGLGRDDVVERGKGEIGIAHPVARILDRLQPAAAAVMHEVAADVQERVAVAQIGDDVAIPDLVEQGLTGHVVFLSPDLPVGRTRTPSFFAVDHNVSSAEGKTAARLSAKLVSSCLRRRFLHAPLPPWGRGWVRG